MKALLVALFALGTLAAPSVYAKNKPASEKGKTVAKNEHKDKADHKKGKKADKTTTTKTTESTTTTTPAPTEGEHHDGDGHEGH